MSRIRGKGNEKTEVRLARQLRGDGISGWRRHLPDPGSTGLCFPKAEGGGVRGWLFLAWVSPLFQVTQAEPGLLEGED